MTPTFVICCGKKTIVTDSRAISGGIRRRRECTVCKTRTTTVEVEATIEVVRGGAGGRQAFPANLNDVLVRTRFYEWKLKVLEALNAITP